MPPRVRLPLVAPKECHTMLLLSRKHVTKLDEEFDAVHQWLDDFTKQAIANLNDHREVFVLKTPRKARKKRGFQLEEGVEVESVAAPPSKRRLSKNRNSRESRLIDEQVDFRSPAVAPAKPPRQRITTRLASMNAARKITETLLEEKTDPAKLRKVAHGSGWSCSAKIESVNVEQEEDVVDIKLRTNEVDSTTASNGFGAVSKKVIEYESNISSTRLTHVGQLTPTLAVLLEDVVSPPALHISSAVLTLSSDIKMYPLVTCSPLDVNKFRRTSRGTYCVSVSSGHKHKTNGAWRLSGRRRSSSARFHRRSEVNRLSGARRLSTSQINVKNDDGELEVGGSRKEVIRLELDEECDGGFQVTEAVSATPDERQNIVEVVSGAPPAAQPATRSVSAKLKRLKVSLRSTTVPITPVVTATKARHLTTSDRSVLKKSSCGRSSGYSSSDVKRVQPCRRNPQVDSAKQSSSHRLRTRTQESQMEMKRVEAIKLKEQKSQNVLKQRDEGQKRKTEEMKRKRDERLRKALKMREEREKQKLIRLKEQEDELMRVQAIAQRKREQEECERQQRLAEQRRINEQRLAERERERERERRMQAEAEKQAEIEAQLMREERERELERERRELERERREQRAEIARAKEQQQRRDQEKELMRKEKQRAVAEDRLKKEAEHNAKALKVSIVNHNSVAPVSQKKDPITLGVVETVKTTAAIMNTTVTVEVAPSSSLTSCISYEITPRRDPTKALPLKNPDNYNISDLKEDDSTDDESQPKKATPIWAQGRQLKLQALKQYRFPPNYAKILPLEDLMQPPKLSDIFPVSKARYCNRTSSANWSSPLFRGETSTSTPT